MFQEEKCKRFIASTTEKYTIYFLIYSMTNYREDQIIVFVFMTYVNKIL